jgi:hypothetical protein
MVRFHVSYPLAPLFRKSPAYEPSHSALRLQRKSRCKRSATVSTHPRHTAREQQEGVTFFHDERSGERPEAAGETARQQEAETAAFAPDDAAPHPSQGSHPAPGPHEPERRGVMSWVKHLFHRDAPPEPGGDPSRPRANGQALAPDGADQLAENAGAAEPATSGGAEPAAAPMADGAAAATPDAARPAAQVEPSLEWAEYAALPDVPPEPQRPAWRDYGEPQPPPAPPQVRAPKSPEPDIDLDL